MEQTQQQVAAKASSGNGLKITAIITSILAICGVGFGVYGMMQGMQKDSQISDLKIQIEGQDGKVTTLETDEIKISDDSQTITINDTKKSNPTISGEGSTQYLITTDTPYYPVDDTDYYVSLVLKDGAINSCNLFTHKSEWVGNDMTVENKFYGNCEGINGISGKIYKAVIAGRGQSSQSSNLAFIMEDGTVSYIPAKDFVEAAVNGETAEIKGKLKIDGFVVDAINANVGSSEQPTSYYGATIMVLSDGSYLEFSDSMLE